MMAGVRGRRERVAMVETASGRVSCVVGSRHGAVPERLFGEIVRVIAYVSRR